MIQHNLNNTLPSTTNEEDACDTDSLGSEWDPHLVSVVVVRRQREPDENSNTQREWPPW